jgi:hypothetical protein
MSKKILLPVVMGIAPILPLMPFITPRPAMPWPDPSGYERDQSATI